MYSRLGSKIDGGARDNTAPKPDTVESKNVNPSTDESAGKEQVVKPAAKDTTTVIKQDESQIGLLVTDQLDAAVQRCKDRVEDIAAMCRSRNQKFRDPEFDIDGDKELCLHGLDSDWFSSYWPPDIMRVTEIYKEPSLFVDGASSSDIAQGRNGDCWFLAALSMVSTFPGLIERLCVAHDQEVGVYGFIFFRDGMWQDVIIDDQLFVNVQPWGDLDSSTQELYQDNPDLYDSIARKGGKILYFARSMEDNETWVPLIEKAFAKFYGCYAYISGGWTMEAVEDLTGGTSTLYMLKDYINKAKLWEELKRTELRDKLYGVFFLQTAKWFGNQGLITGHAYSVLRAAEYNDKKFVVIRNPWGKTEWQGPWGDGSKEWTKEWMPALEVLNHKFGDDGEFVMEFSDFTRQWRCMDSVRLFDSSWVVSNIWVALNGISLNHPWTWGDVSFTIHVDEATPAVIVLQQLDTRSFREISSTIEYNFDFVMFKKGSKRVFAASGYNFSGMRSKNAEVDLEAGDYVVHVRIDSRKNTFWRSEEDKKKTEDEDGEEKEEKVEWDNRRLKRVMARKTLAFSKALNFTEDKLDSTVPIDLNDLAGVDLNEVEINLVKAKREVEEERKNKRKATKKLNEEEEEAAKAAELKAKLAEKGAEGEAAAAGGAPVHKDTKCDVCEMNPIVGIRYHCNNTTACPDFDMCQECFNKGSHDKTHELLVYTQPRPLTHVGIQCATCEPKADVAGVLFKCTVEGCTRQYSCKACMDKTPHEASHTLLMVPAPESKKEQEKEKPHTHEGITCDGCGTSPIVGIRYKCLETSCPNYDICEKCMKKGIHPASHNMLPIVEPEESKFLNPLASEGVTTTVLGLRVYTKKSAPSVLEAQIRHGSLRIKGKKAVVQ